MSSMTIKFFLFVGVCRQGRVYLLFLSEKRALQHKPCHIDLITVPLTQLAFIWKQTIEYVQYRCHLPRISLISHKLKTESRQHCIGAVMQCSVKGAYPLRVDVFKQGECDAGTKAFAGIIHPPETERIQCYCVPCASEEVCVDSGVCFSSWKK